MRVEGACSANLLVRRQALFRSGGFDERYWGVCEDTDLGFRLAQQSYNVWHDPRPAVDHLMLKGGGSRPSAKDWTEQHLALILPIKFKLHLLLLTEHFGWLTSARFLLIRLFQYLRPSRLYLQQPLLPFIVSKLVATAFYESMKLNKRGQQLPLISGKIQGYYHD